MSRKPSPQINRMMLECFKQSHTFSKTLSISEFFRYFSNNNSINCLTNTFITIKQEDIETIFNQFIHGLHSSILQHVCPLHLATLQAAVTHARNFELAESEANHAQAVNLIMNGSSDLDSKLKQFIVQSINHLNDVIIQEMQITSKINHVHSYPQYPISHSNKRYVSATAVQPTIRKSILKPQLPVPNSEQLSKSKSINLLVHDAAANLSTTSISNSSISTTSHLLTTATDNLSTTIPNNLSSAAPNNLSNPPSSNAITKLTSKQDTKAENNTTKLEIGDNSSTTNLQFINSTIGILLDTIFHNSEFNQQPILTNNIPPATVTNNETLAAIFLFEFKTQAITLLFSRATLKKKPITVMYINAKVDRHSIKLILDTASIRIITANGITKTPIDKIDDFPIEVNGIIVLIKVLVMEATQYQALVGNDWLFKTKAMLDWTTQELQIKKEKKPTWEVYQVSWADNNYNELPPILLWDNDMKEKQREKLTWETDDLKENNQRKGKGKVKEKEPLPTTLYTSYNYTTLPPTNYHWPKLVCVNCDKKLSSMGTYYGNNKEYHVATKFYCHLCVVEQFRRPKRQEKWDNELCLTCEEMLLDEEMWNNISGRRETCDKSNWIKKKIPIEVVWIRAVRHLNSYSHDDDKIWQMIIAKIEKASPKEIREIKNNLPELVELDWNKKLVINLLELEKFHEHYQTLAPTKEEQKEHLAQLNT
ncbi:hypothetical protein G9A89_005527 [Geosiphon pyriformis]|nr:hypothetical protein G9A89_005527 [Geosiphon pyriformis]